jgi:hypothetical protein
LSLPSGFSATAFGVLFAVCAAPVPLGFSRSTLCSSFDVVDDAVACDAFTGAVLLGSVSIFEDFTLYSLDWFCAKPFALSPKPAINTIKTNRISLP